MQALTAPPRDSLTSDQVTALLVADVLQVDYGVELLASDLSVVEDISTDVAGGEIARSMYAKIHGTCTLKMSRDLAWGTDLVRPYMLLSASGVTARWNVGVFAMATSDQPLAQTPTTYEVQGYDRLYLLDRDIGDFYAFVAGSKVLDSVRQTITAAGLSGVLLDGTAQDKTLPADMVWKRDDTWLKVVNDLLATVNYRGIWADQDGQFRSEPYLDPSVRPIEWAFDVAAVRTLIAQERTLAQDQWKAPNKWIFVQSNRASGAAQPSEGDGIYTVVNQSDGPSSIDARGLTWAKTYPVDVADQASLQASGDRQVAADKRVTATLTLKTGPWPGAGHFDVYTISDPAFGLWRVQASAWSFELSGGDVEWTWERVI